MTLSRSPPGRAPPPAPPYPNQVDPDRFAAVREALAKEYRNVRFSQPYQWALYRLDVSRAGARVFVCCDGGDRAAG